MRKLILAVALAAPVALGGCNGDTRIGPSSDLALKVETVPPTASHCLVTNDSGAWGLFSTPGYVDIHRSSSPLDIKCNNSRGWFGHIQVPADLEPEGIVDAVLVGGLAATAAVAIVQPQVAVAAAVGAGLGAGGLTVADSFAEDRAHTYPGVIRVPMYAAVADLTDAVGHPASPEAGGPAVKGGAAPAHKKRVHHHKAAKKKPDCTCAEAGHDAAPGQPGAPPDAIAPTTAPARAGQAPPQS